MKLDTFDLIVNKGREVANGYVEMSHNTEYSLSMRNNRNVDCDAVVRVDGVEIGTWRISSHQSILIERPATVDRKFTFYRLGTSESYQAGLNRDDNLGLISVEFIPAKEVERGLVFYGEGSPSTYGSKGVERTYGNPYNKSSACETKGYNAGGTGLGDHSDQSFGQADSIDRDYSKRVTINLRLCCVDKPTIVSLRGISNPVPPPIF